MVRVGSCSLRMGAGASSQLEHAQLTVKLGLLRAQVRAARALDVPDARAEDAPERAEPGAGEDLVSPPGARGAAARAVPRLERPHREVSEHESVQPVTLPALEYLRRVHKARDAQQRAAGQLLLQQQRREQQQQPPPAAVEEGEVRLGASQAAPRLTLADGSVLAASSVLELDRRWRAASGAVNNRFDTGAKRKKRFSVLVRDDNAAAGEEGREQSPAHREAMVLAALAHTDATRLARATAPRVRLEQPAYPFTDLPRAELERLRDTFLQHQQLFEAAAAEAGTTPYRTKSDPGEWASAELGRQFVLEEAARARRSLAQLRRRRRRRSSGGAGEGGHVDAGVDAGANEGEGEGGDEGEDKSESESESENENERVSDNPETVEAEVLADVASAEASQLASRAGHGVPLLEDGAGEGRGANAVKAARQRELLVINHSMAEKQQAIETAVAALDAAARKWRELLLQQQQQQQQHAQAQQQGRPTESAGAHRGGQRQPSLAKFIALVLRHLFLDMMQLEAMDSHFVALEAVAQTRLEPFLESFLALVRERSVAHEARREPRSREMLLMELQANTSCSWERGAAALRECGWELALATSLITGERVRPESELAQERFEVSVGHRRVKVPGDAPPDDDSEEAREAVEGRQAELSALEQILAAVRENDCGKVRHAVAICSDREVLLALTTALARSEPDPEITMLLLGLVDAEARRKVMLLAAARDQLGALHMLVRLPPEQALPRRVCDDALVISAKRGSATAVSLLVGYAGRDAAQRALLAAAAADHVDVLRGLLPHATFGTRLRALEVAKAFSATAPSQPAPPLEQQQRRQQQQQQEQPRAPSSAAVDPLAGLGRKASVLLSPSPAPEPKAPVEARQLKPTAGRCLKVLAAWAQTEALREERFRAKPRVDKEPAKQAEEAVAAAPPTAALVARAPAALKAWTCEEPLEVEHLFAQLGKLSPPIELDGRTLFDLGAGQGRATLAAALARPRLARAIGFEKDKAKAAVGHLAAERHIRHLEDLVRLDEQELDEGGDGTGAAKGVPDERIDLRIVCADMHAKGNIWVKHADIVLANREAMPTEEELKGLRPGTVVAFYLPRQSELKPPSALVMQRIAAVNNPTDDEDRLWAVFRRVEDAPQSTPRSTPAV